MLCRTLKCDAVSIVAAWCQVFRAHVPSCIVPKQAESKQEAFEKCWAHSPPRAVLHCHSPGVATVARRLRIDVHDDSDDNNYDNA